MGRGQLSSGVGGSRDRAVGASAERLWTAAEYAAFTSRTTQAVAHERCRGGGPPFIKVGKRVLYDPVVVRGWLAARQVQSTAEMAV